MDPYLKKGLEKSEVIDDRPITRLPPQTQAVSLARPKLVVSRDARERETEERYKALVEAQSELIVRLTPDGCFTFVNDAYCRKAGQSREQLLGGKFTPQVHPEDRDQVWTFFQGVLRPP